MVDLATVEMDYVGMCVFVNFLRIFCLNAHSNLCPLLLFTFLPL